MEKQRQTTHHSIGEKKHSKDLKSNFKQIWKLVSNLRFGQSRSSAWCQLTLSSIMLKNGQTYFKNHHVKYRNFTQFPSVENLWKGTVCAQFWANRPKLCGNCVFSQNFYTGKLGEITVFYVVIFEVCLAVFQQQYF